MRKLVIGFFILLLGILSYYFIFQKSSSFNSQVNTSNLQKVSLRLKWINQAQFAGFYMAQEKGFYERNGLNVQINPGGPDISPLQMVITNADDFGITGADQILIAREKGIPVVALAVIYKQSPVVLASLKENNIQTPQDLVGKTVAVVYGRDEEMIYKALLSKENIDRTTINEIPKTFDSSQIETKKADAAIVYEPDEPVIMEQRGFAVNLIKPSEYGIKFYGDTLFTTEKMIKEHPDLVRNFVQATLEGWDLSLTNQNEAIDIVLRKNPSLNRQHQARFLEISTPLIKNESKIGTSDAKTWNTIKQILLDQGVIKKDIDVIQAYNNSFLSQ